MRREIAWRVLLCSGLWLLLSACTGLRGSGDLGVVIERGSGSLLVVDTTAQTSLGQVQGLGDVSHASVVFSRDARYAYVFGRDGGLTKVDLLRRRIVRRIIQAGNSIGGAISQDGKMIAVSNYEPGGVRIFAADSLAPLVDIPAQYGTGSMLQTSKVVGLVDAPDQRFVFSLFDAGEIWLADVSDVTAPRVEKFTNIGVQPYDALISPDGRYYLAGLFGEDGLAMLDLWQPEHGVQRILGDYGRGERKLPVYKMPHLEGWAMAGPYVFVPAVGHHEVLVIDRETWQLVKRIPMHGQPVFVMARPDGRQIWVNFAHPLNDTVEVIDVLTLEKIQQLTPGKAVLHMEFTSRGEQVWISVRDDDRINIYSTRDFSLLKQIAANKPSGIFFTHRAHRIGL